MYLHILCTVFAVVAGLVVVIPPASNRTLSNADKITTEHVVLQTFINKFVPWISPWLIIIKGLCMVRIIMLNDPSFAHLIPSISQLLPGIFLMFFGAVLRLWCFWELGHLFTYTLTIRKEHKLVITGPYRFLCHPSYTGILLFSAGLACNVDCAVYTYYIANLPFIIYFIIDMAMSAIPLFFRMSAEDQMLASHFGKSWELYRNDRWRLVPFIY